MEDYYGSIKPDESKSFNQTRKRASNCFMSSGYAHYNVPLVDSWTEPFKVIKFAEEHPGITYQSSSLVPVAKEVDSKLSAVLVSLNSAETEERFRPVCENLMSQIATFWRQEANLLE